MSFNETTLDTLLIFLKKKKIDTLLSCICFNIYIYFFPLQVLGVAKNVGQPKNIFKLTIK